MLTLRIIWYYFWVAPHILQTIILFAMVRRGLHRQFPMFFIYTGFEIVQSGLLMGVVHFVSYFGPVYFQVYAVGLAISTAIRFGVIHELFSSFFRRYPALGGIGKILFRMATVVLLAIAVGLAISAPGNVPAHVLAEGPYSSLSTTTFAADRAVSVLQCGLLISLFLFSRYFALSWRSPAFGIALGLGTFASAELAITAVRLYPSISSAVVVSNRTLDLISLGIYHLCVVVWILYLVLIETEPKFTSKTLPKYDLEIWNQELRRLLQQ